MNEVMVFHQCGFRDSWNFDSFLNDNAGDGLILSPINEEYGKLIQKSEVIKSSSFFDPQFYLPRSIHPALNSYDFFPNNIANGYETQDYHEFAYRSAELCIDFQNDNGFRYIVIPTISFGELPINYLAQLKDLYTLPFLEKIISKKIVKPILLSIIVKDIQINDAHFRDELLTYLTSFTEISGIYLIPDNKRTYKRIKDIDYLYNLMTFIDTLKNNGLEVHLGYTDIEGYILSLASPDSISMGAYENLRRYDPTKFDKKEEKKMNGPSPRLYSNKLLQWIDQRYLNSIKSDFDRFDELFDKNKYKVIMFQPEYNWHFTKPELYKHFFISYYNQIKALPNSFDSRYEYLMEKIKQAMGVFDEISQYVLLDSNSDGSHLSMWGSALKKFVNYKRGV